MTTAAEAVTVVVPACNVERYLAECLDSLLSQTVWADCRVIVVDDGSTDSTASVADSYAARHPAISVLRQANAGPGAGAARNHGLDEVVTAFVLFLDGDDELTPTAIERLRAGLVQDSLYLAVGATEQFPEPRRWIWSDYFVPGEARTVGIEDLPLLAHDARTCNKLYRTSWLRAQGLRFAEGIHHQDTVVNIPAMLLAERFWHVGDVVHRYRKRAEGGSVMDSHFTRVQNYWDHLQVIEELHAMRPRFRPSREPLMQAFIARSFQGFTWRAPDVLPAEQLPEFFRRAAAIVRTLDPEVIELATRSAGERAAYATMLEDDFASFVNLGELVQRLEAHEGDLYLGIPTTNPDHLRLLKAGAARALATGLAVRRSGVELSLGLRVRGLPRPDLALTGATLRLLAGEEAAFATAVIWTGADGTQSLGHVTIPWSALTSGEYRLRLRFITPTGTAARWLRRPAHPSDNAGWVTAEHVRTPLARVSLSAQDNGLAQLTVSLGYLLKLRRRIVAWLRRRREPVPGVRV